MECFNQGFSVYTFYVWPRSRRRFFRSWEMFQKFVWTIFCIFSFFSYFGRKRWNGHKIFLFPVHELYTNLYVYIDKYALTGFCKINGTGWKLHSSIFSGRIEMVIKHESHADSIKSEIKPIATRIFLFSHCARNEWWVLDFNAKLFNR